MAVLTLAALQTKINNYLRVGGVPAKINATEVKELLTDMKDTLAALPETDPVFGASAAGGIITQDIEKWYQAYGSVITGMAPRELTGGNTANMLNHFNALFYTELSADLTLAITNAIPGAAGTWVINKTTADAITITFPSNARSTFPTFQDSELELTGPLNSLHEVSWLYLTDSASAGFYLVYYSGLYQA